MSSPEIIEVFVNERPIVLLAGMTVRHALVGAGLWREEAALRIMDEWGNELGVEGPVYQGMKMKTVLKMEETKHE